MLTNLLKVFVRQFSLSLGAGLARTGLTPNTLTLIGLALSVGVAAILATGHLLLGGVAVLIASAFDMLDGALARASGRVTRFGAFLDSCLDRFAEAIILVGLLIHFMLQPGGQTEIILIYATIVGSLMISYTRARAEGLGLSAEVGLLHRPERVVILGLGLIVGWITWALWLLAVLTNVTAIQRIVHVWRKTRYEH